MIAPKKIAQVERLLEQGVPQREIRRRTGVGRHTITAIATGRRKSRGTGEQGSRGEQLGVLDRLLKKFGLRRERYFHSPEDEADLSMDLRGDAIERYKEVAAKKAAKKAAKERKKTRLPAVPFVRTDCAQCGTPLRVYLFRDGTARVYDETTFERVRTCPGCDRDLSRATVAQVLGEHDDPEFFDGP